MQFTKAPQVRRISNLSTSRLVCRALRLWLVEAELDRPAQCSCLSFKVWQSRRHPSCLSLGKSRAMYLPWWTSGTKRRLNLNSRHLRRKWTGIITQQRHRTRPRVAHKIQMRSTRILQRSRSLRNRQSLPRSRSGRLKRCRQTLRVRLKVREPSNCHPIKSMWTWIKIAAPLWRLSIAEGVGCGSAPSMITLHLQECTCNWVTPRTLLAYATLDVSAVAKWRDTQRACSMFKSARTKSTRHMCNWRSFWPIRRFNSNCRFKWQNSISTKDQTPPQTTSVVTLLMQPKISKWQTTMRPLRKCFCQSWTREAWSTLWEGAPQQTWLTTCAPRRINLQMVMPSQRWSILQPSQNLKWPRSLRQTLMPMWSISSKHRHLPTGRNPSKEVTFLRPSVHTHSRSLSRGVRTWTAVRSLCRKGESCSSPSTILPSSPSLCPERALTSNRQSRALLLSRLAQKAWCSPTTCMPKGCF